ncbi:MAG TPA: ribonucleotide-diphosphate reductase subunit beta [Solirubrobacterales bacterium]|nr:ribonucleotide-diphosphate reductase subunit beta [Solirubrobacterales bacterium]
MASTLLDLTQQGDVATISDESKLDKIKLLTPQQLYELWERQQWLSQQIDFAQDKDDWAGLTDEEREWFVWGMSAFFLGEERVTTQFSGLVMAYEDEQEEAFLTTQQVDEARHMQFFDRFYREVVGMADVGIRERLATVRENVNDDFVQLFDGALVDAERRLIADPANVEAKVDFITAYHMVIEGTLALTGQWTITDYWEKTGKMQGFLEGFKNVARDEHRHVAYGTWYLKRACAGNEALANRVRATLSELLPIASGVLVPPGQDPNDWELLGYTSEQVNQFAYTALARRLKVIGVSLVAPEPAPA